MTITILCHQENKGIGLIADSGTRLRSRYVPDEFLSQRNELHRYGFPKKRLPPKNGNLSYRRRKTGQQLIIEWAKEMQMILDKYPEKIKAITCCPSSVIPALKSDAPIATPATTSTTA